jgi:hypothetical protein
VRVLAISHYRPVHFYKSRVRGERPVLVLAFSTVTFPLILICLTMILAARATIQFCLASIPTAARRKVLLETLVMLL